MAGTILDRSLGALARLSERTVIWHKLPMVLGLIIAIGHRVNLRRHNLVDTETAPPDLDEPTDPGLPDDFDRRGWRLPDGTFNDRDVPWMGAAGRRFGRNVPLKHAYRPRDDQLMNPSPRVVSNRLLARKSFAPVPHLNILAAAWIQFMVHDWLGHGRNDKSRVHDIPLPEGDDWPSERMTALATTVASPQGPADESKPRAFTNVETSWWDASQIYGSSWQRMEKLRRAADGTRLDNGKLALDERGLLPLDEELQAKRPGQELAGVNGNWWIGLSVLHTLFVHEHNAIVDRLRLDYPRADGEWLFQKARLVNAALLAKIHTVEWTPALMDSPIGRGAMRGNYWGLAGERVITGFGQISDSEVVSGIPGTPTAHHGAPYSMTEEFTAVYRLHPLLPDDFTFRSAEDDRVLQAAGLRDVTFGKTRALYDHMSFSDALYTLATSNPGAMTLHNYPNVLRRLDKKPEEGIYLDLAAVDVLRDRERGVPRYAEFRELIGCRRPTSFAEITDDHEDQRLLEEVYGTVDRVDLLTGCLAEANSSRNWPPRFGFSDTAFRIFIVMASRRLKSDRFYTDDFTPEVYTPAGFAWVENSGFKEVVQRHAPALAPLFADARNPFFPWARAGS
ncbi:MAG: peroxidase [Alphaproteobacteria bacterium]|jgi:hypothetical protein|nr:peroxidase [Alphaproteobacteria bacterium]